MNGPFRTRSAGSAAPVSGLFTSTRAATAARRRFARVHNLGKPPRMLVILQLDGSADRPATGDTVTAGGRNVGRIGTVVEHADEGPIALALLKRGLPVDTALIAGEQAQAPAVIDPDSMPAADATAGAGRAAVERLRGR